MASPTPRPRAPRCGPARRPQRDRTDWLDLLPKAWREMAIKPLDFVDHHEYEIAASRSLGYDVDGQLCYYAHGYALDEPRSDDDDEFYLVVAYSETVHAWRLRDDRWLIHRIAHHGGECAPGRGFYCFAADCPR
jgi:hypothetical protein